MDPVGLRTESKPPRLAARGKHGSGCCLPDGECRKRIRQTFAADAVEQLWVFVFIKVELAVDQEDSTVCPARKILSGDLQRADLAHARVEDVETLAGNPKRTSHKVGHCRLQESAAHSAVDKQVDFARSHSGLLQNRTAGFQDQLMRRLTSSTISDVTSVRATLLQHKSHLAQIAAECGRTVGSVRLRDRCQNVRVCDFA